jgi:flagellar operon protein
MGENGKINNLLIPQVSKLPKSKKSDAGNKVGEEGKEFKSLLDQTIDQGTVVPKQEGIHLSTHAQKRIQERNLMIDNDEFFKLKGAFDKLREKGGQDSLIITDKAAYIVDVNSNKIVTAIDKGSIAENVFTKIDSTVVV